MNLWNPAQFEEKLAKRCLEGEARAWEELVRLYTRRIYNLAYRYLRNASQAEDLTQEIFLRVYQTISSYRAETGSLTNWLLRVARNLIIDHYRQAKRYAGTSGSEELERLSLADPKQTGALERVQRQQDCHALWIALGKLSPELREAVVLRDLEELSYQEIESILAVPQGTVKSRINRGRLELAKAMRSNQEKNVNSPSTVFATE
jgi:RNA polymerase sigma-70 factor, ECF subfamily